MMMKLSAALAFAFVLLSLGGEEIRIHETSWSDRTPVLDGRIENDPAWEKIPWEPGGFFLHRKKLSPSNDTKFKSLYTADEHGDGGQRKDLGHRRCDGTLLSDRAERADPSCRQSRRHEQ